MEEKDTTVEEKVSVDEVPEVSAADKEVDAPLVAEEKVPNLEPEAPKPGGWGIKR